MSVKQLCRHPHFSTNIFPESRRGYRYRMQIQYATAEHNM